MECFSISFVFCHIPAIRFNQVKSTGRSSSWSSILRAGRPSSGWRSLKALFTALAWASRSRFFLAWIFFMRKNSSRSISSNSVTGNEGMEFECFCLGQPTNVGQSVLDLWDDHVLDGIYTAVCDFDGLIQGYEAGLQSGQLHQQLDGTVVVLKVKVRHHSHNPMAFAFFSLAMLAPPFPKPVRLYASPSDPSRRCASNTGRKTPDEDGLDGNFSIYSPTTLSFFIRT